MSEHDDLERRLRAALSAKAEQVTDADLDRAREDEVAEQLRATDGRPSRRRLFTGAGIAAAAAAIIGVGALAIHPGGSQAPVNAASHLSSSFSSASTGATATADGSGQEQPRMTKNANGAHPPASLTGPTSDLQSSAVTGSAGSAAPHRTVLSQGSPGSVTTSPVALPTLPADLPQAGPLGSGEYFGPVPITDASGGPTRMLNMPNGTKWQVLSQTDTSLTVRITDLPTDIEAYWSKILPAYGWVQSDGGWQIPDTSYAVSAISDKAAFTVSW